MSKLEERETRRKKSIINNIVSGGPEPLESEFSREKQEGKGRPKVNREIKKRISLVVLPSLYTNIQKIAYVNRISVSDLLAELMTGYVAQNADKLEEYNRITQE